MSFFLFALILALVSCEFKALVWENDQSCTISGLENVADLETLTGVCSEITDEMVAAIGYQIQGYYSLDCSTSSPLIKVYQDAQCSTPYPIYSSFPLPTTCSADTFGFFNGGYGYFSCKDKAGFKTDLNIDLDADFYYGEGFINDTTCSELGVKGWQKYMNCEPYITQYGPRYVSETCAEGQIAMKIFDEDTCDETEQFITTNIAFDVCTEDPEGNGGKILSCVVQEDPNSSMTIKTSIVVLALIFGLLF